MGFKLPPDAETFLRRCDQVERQGPQLVKLITEGQELLEKLLRNRFEGIEFLADAWADYELARAEIEADDLIKKKHPAYQSADVVRAKSKELSVTRRRLKYLQQVVKLYEWHVPWLTELREIEEEESYAKLAAGDDDSGDDPVRQWMTNEEYQSLKPSERNQRALDRYWKSRKTRWQVGRDYERYVGYLYERDGYAVVYEGIEKGLDDLGRDVIARNGKSITVVQCKRWAKERTIHEKHIFQLFGTVTAFRIDNPAAEVVGRFVTTTKLSERAKAFARRLDITVDETFALDESYPCIKCNVAQGTGERIYHLPFDQMYDATLVTKKGEFYARTVQEAEKAGFRRAFRWRGAGESAPSAAAN